VEDLVSVVRRDWAMNCGNRGLAPPVDHGLMESLVSIFRMYWDQERGEGEIRITIRITIKITTSSQGASLNLNLARNRNLWLPVQGEGGGRSGRKMVAERWG